MIYSVSVTDLLSNNPLGLQDGSSITVDGVPEDFTLTFTFPARTLRFDRQPPPIRIPDLIFYSTSLITDDHEYVVGVDFDSEMMQGGIFEKVDDFPPLQQVGTWTATDG